MKVLAAAVLFALAGCGSSHAKFSDVHAGMSTGHVRDMLGQPAAEVETDKAVNWYYQYPDLRGFEVCFVNGRVRAAKTNPVKDAPDWAASNAVCNG